MALGLVFVDPVRAVVCGWLELVASKGGMGMDIHDSFTFFPLSYIRWLVATSGIAWAGSPQSLFRATWYFSLQNGLSTAGLFNWQLASPRFSGSQPS